MARFEKYTKEECDYGQGEWPRECGTCAHYINYPTRSGYEKHGSCKIVQGRIGEHDLCKFHVYAKGKEDLEDRGSEEIQKPRNWKRTEQRRNFGFQLNPGETPYDWCDACEQWMPRGHTH